MGRLHARLIVFLKGADLVAQTAYLTLSGKLNYEGRLLALKRFDHFSFQLESDRPESVVPALRETLARQSTFYNRNKHGHLLHCTWEGGEFQEGPALPALKRQLAGEVSERLFARKTKDFDGQDTLQGVIFKQNRVYLVEALVETRDSALRDAVSRKLRVDLGGIPLTVSSSGTLWWLALHARDAGDARATADEIVVAQRRDRGLLLNPNYQRFDVVSLEEMELARDV